MGTTFIKCLMKSEYTGVPYITANYYAHETEAEIIETALVGNSVVWVQFVGEPFVIDNKNEGKDNGQT